MKEKFSVVVKNLSVKFNDFYAVNNISFSVKPGEIFGFLGANGAGKTTTIRVLCGLLKPSAGFVRVAGVEFETAELAIKSKVGYMSQKFTLYNDLTVEENLSFIAALRKLALKSYLKRQDEILDFISFAYPLDTFIKDLPGGIEQQVSLAGAILHDPEIVFLDEPTAGVTPSARARFWKLIQKLAHLGKTIFVTTHYMDEAEQCQRIALMKTGEIVAMDSPGNLKQSVFSEGIYELEAGNEISYSTMIKLRNDPTFDFFEPYGLKFHAVFKKSPAAEKLKARLAQHFRIKAIEPTLEDVFIKVVEGKKG